MFLNLLFKSSWRERFYVKDSLIIKAGKRVNVASKCKEGIFAKIINLTLLLVSDNNHIT